MYAHPAVVPRHVRICEHLGDHRPQRRRTECFVARCRELEQLAKENHKRRELLRCSEREELGDFEGAGATRARVIRKGGIVKEPCGLLYRVSQENFVRDAWRKRVRILRVILRRKMA
jgi:hypothetical protein